jgi:hypothetical protein
MRIIALVVSVMVFGAATVSWATVAFAEPEGFVIEAVMASPEANSPLRRDTPVEIAAGGYIVIITRNGQMVRQDGPFQGPASSLMDAIITPGENELGNPILSSLFDLAGVIRAGEEHLGGLRGAVIETAVHPWVITNATTALCLVAGARPDFYVSRPPARDEPVTFRTRISPRGILHAKWPVGATILPWPDSWPSPMEGRYIWTLGDRGPTPLRIRVVETPPENLPERAAFYHDLQCDTQAVALMRSMIESAKHQ